MLIPEAMSHPGNGSMSFCTFLIGRTFYKIRTALGQAWSGILEAAKPKSTTSLNVLGKLYSLPAGHINFCSY